MRALHIAAAVGLAALLGGCSSSVTPAATGTPAPHSTHAFLLEDSATQEGMGNSSTPLLSRMPSPGTECVSDFFLESARVVDGGNRKSSEPAAAYLFVVVVDSSGPDRHAVQTYPASTTPRNMIFFHEHLTLQWTDDRPLVANHTVHSGTATTWDQDWAWKDDAGEPFVTHTHYRFTDLGTLPIAWEQGAMPYCI